MFSEEAVRHLDPTFRAMVEHQLRTDLLLVAIKKKEPKWVRYWLHHGAQTDVIGADGLTPLHYAVLSNDIEIVTHLLEFSAPIDAAFVDGDYTSPLMIAAEEGNMEIAAMLLSQGPLVDLRDDNGLTALGWCPADKRDISEKVLTSYRGTQRPETQDYFPE